MSRTQTLRNAAGFAFGASIFLGASQAMASDGPEACESGVVETEGVNFSVVACPPGEAEEAHEKLTKAFTTSRSKVIIKQDHGDGEHFELKMNDGDIIVLRNGKQIQQKHIKKFPGGTIKILGDSGDELTTFELEGMGQAPKSGNIQKLWVDGNKHGNVVISGDADFAFGFSPDANVQIGGAHPPVMLGIHMGEPGPALRYHLGLKDHDAILVEGVTEGLAADEAGLKKYDVIVSIDGSGEANGDVLHKVMSKKEAGDELRLIIMRGCDKIRVTAELDEYNANKLNAGAHQFGVFPGADENVFKFRTAPKIAQGRPFVWSDNQGHVLELLHEKLRGQMSDEQLEQTHRAIEEALRGMDFDMSFELDGHAPGVMEFRWDGKDHKLVIPKPARLSEVPVLSSLFEDRVADLAEKQSAEAHERLNERLERLSEEIERLRESLEDLD